MMRKVKYGSAFLFGCLYIVLWLIVLHMNSKVFAILAVASTIYIAIECAYAILTCWND